MESQITLRRPEVEDVDKLYSSFIESIGTRTSITKSTLKDDLFGKSIKDPIVKVDDPCVQFDYKMVEDDSPIIKVYLAEVAGKLIGHIVYHYHFSPWMGHMVYIDDIYTKPEYRRIGVAKKLYNQVSRESKIQGINECIFQLGCRNSDIKDLVNKFEPEVYRNDETDWSVYRIDW